MIDAISLRLAMFIQSNSEDASPNPDKVEIMQYGLSILIFRIITFVITITAALFLGTTKYFFVAVITFGALRVYSGGAHTRSRIQCFASHSIIIFGSIYLAKWLSPISLALSIILFSANIIILAIFSPMDTEEKPIVNPKIRLKCKIISIIISILLSITAIISYKYDYTIYNIIVLVYIPVLFFITPAGYFITGSKTSNGKMMFSYKRNRKGGEKND